MFHYKRGFCQLFLTPLDGRLIRSKATRRTISPVILTVENFAVKANRRHLNQLPFQGVVIALSG